MKRVLIITYDFYPENTPNTYRWNSIIEEWLVCEPSIEIFVVCANTGGLVNYEVVNGVHVYRIETLLGKLKSTSTVNLVNDNLTVEKVSKIKEILSNTLGFIYFEIVQKLYYPDHAFTFLIPAYNIAKRLVQENDIKNVVTVSWPFTDSLIGLLLKKKFKNKIKWVVDIIDPFCFDKKINNYKIYKRLNVFFDKKVIEKCDYSFVLTDVLKKEYLKLWPQYEDKIGVSENLVKLTELGKENLSLIKKKLVFIGTLNSEVRNPNYLLLFFVQLLESDSMYELHFYGNIADTKNEFKKYEKLIGKNIFIHGVVSKEESLKLMNEAQVVFNIGNSNKYQEPSKIFEYIFYRKKIIHIYCIEEDTCNRILSKYCLSKQIHISEIKDLCFKEIINFIDGEILLDIKDESFIREVCEKRMSKSIALKYYEELKNY